MAISKTTQTYGLLNAWQSICTEDIWRFNQIEGDGAQSSACAVYVQDEREQIARSLRQSWDRITTYLGYFPRPIWTSEVIRLGRGRPWQLQHLRTHYGYVQAFGQRGVELIAANASVVYSDSDGDGVDDLATITVNTPVDEEDIQVFFRTADGAPASGHELWQIEPITVTSAGGTVTITGHRALFVKPATIWNVPYVDANRRTRNAGHTSDASDFVTEVDVYRVYNDTSTQVEVIADPIFSRGDLGGNILETGVVRLLDDVNGHFEVRIENPSCLKYAEAVRVHYKAGMPLEFGQMNLSLLTSLIRLANTFQPNKLCTFCDQTENVWADDRRPPGTSENPVSERLINNPLGTMKGQVFAWQTVLDMMLVRGGAL